MSLLDKATIITTPTAHSNGVLHSIKGGSVADFDVVRGSAATRVNAEGLIEDVVANIPRIDYTDGTASILLEPQSTNLIPYSEDFSQWTNSDITIGGNGISPSGEVDANLIQTGTAGSDQINEAYTLSATNTVTQSIYIKRVGGAEWVDFLILRSGFSNSVKVWFNINTGQIGGNTQTGTTTLDSALIEDFGNGWYKLKITTTDTTNNTSFNIRVRTALADLSDTRVNNSSYYLWGAQLEELPYATSYIPTSGQIATRLSDSVSGAGDATTFNSTEGVLYFEGAMLQAASGTQVLGLSDGSGANRIGFQTSATANQIRFVVDAGGNQASEFFVLDDITDFNKLALKWKQNDFSFWVNGIKIGTDTSGNVPSLNALNTLDFYYGTGIFNFYGKVKSLITFDTALTDAELECLTTI